MKIQKPFITWEEFEGIVGGAWTPSAHTHVKAEITDTPWAWADVNKAGSNLTDLATRQHAGLTNITSDQHHPQLHEAEHEVGGGDLIAFADITGFGTWLDQAVKQASSPIFHDLILNQGAADGEILAFKSSDIAHGMTGIAETDTYGWYKKKSATLGGVDFLGLSEGTEAFFVTGVAITEDTTKTAASLAPVSMQAGKKSGIGGGFVGADANLFVVKNWGQTKFIVDGSGNIYSVGGGFYGVTARLTDLTNAFVPYHVSDAAGLANSPIQIDGANVGIGKVPTEKLDVDGTVKATLFEGNLHWDNITNEPSFYPPEYHYHVGKDIVSLHLVDLDDVDADDIFDVLATGNIHTLGNYDWFGTWQVLAGAGCTVEVVVLAGDDKYLRLTDNNAGQRATVTLTTVADHPMVISAIQFQIRQSVNNKEGVIFFAGSGNDIYIIMAADGNMKFFDGTGTTVLQAYAANTWYTVRIYCDCVGQGVAVFVENVYKTRETLTLDYINQIYIRTKTTDTGYTLDINNLKVFNLTV